MSDKPHTREQQQQQPSNGMLYIARPSTSMVASVAGKEKEK
jgi:hypothetical protein